MSFLWIGIILKNCLDSVCFYPLHSRHLFHSKYLFIVDARWTTGRHGSYTPWIPFLRIMSTLLIAHKHGYIAKWGVLLPSITDEQAADRVKKVKRITSTGGFILARWVDMKPYERKWKYIPDFKQRRYFINEIPSHGGFYRVIKVEKCPFLCCKDRAFGIQWMF